MKKTLVIFSLAIATISCTDKTPLSNTNEDTKDFTIKKQRLTANDVENHVNMYGVNYNTYMSEVSSEFGIENNSEENENMLHYIALMMLDDDQTLGGMVLNDIRSNRNYYSAAVISSYENLSFSDGGRAKHVLLKFLSSIGGDNAYSFIYDELMAEEIANPEIQNHHSTDAYSQQLLIKISALRIFYFCYKSNNNNQLCLGALFDALSEDNVIDELKLHAALLLKDLNVSNSEIYSHLQPNLHSRFDLMRFADSSDLVPIEYDESEDPEDLCSSDPVDSEEECDPPAFSEDLEN